jgi:hypothetical protein
MPHYFLVHDATRFHSVICPALAASWRQQNFEPCGPLRAALAADLKRFVERYHIGEEVPVLSRIDPGWPFDRYVWRALVGEALLYGAAEVPEFQTTADTLCCVLAPQNYRAGPAPRERFTAIEQALWGSRDLVFGGGWFRPDHAGWNDRSDVAQLGSYLASIQPAQWTVADLAELRNVEVSDRAEELESAREWFEPLREMYQRAAASDQIVVCELL